jgi:hypothetical protein
MRTITTHHDGHGLNENVQIIALDDKEGPACHHYIFNVNPGPVEKLVGELRFQQGPRNEAGSTPGVVTAAVLAMLIDHLEGFQRGPYPSRETAIVIKKLEEALHWTRARADKRAARGVLGRNEK